MEYINQRNHQVQDYLCCSVFKRCKDYKSSDIWGVFFSPNFVRKRVVLINFNTQKPIAYAMPFHLI